MGRPVIYQVKPGDRFGRLVVTDAYEGLLRVPCRCDCGAAYIGRKDNLRSGTTTSCGCLRVEMRYAIDHAFFSEIDTEAKAYWLGFLAADGCIVDRRKTQKRAGQIRLHIQAGDIGHLEKLKVALGAEVPIRVTTGVDSRLVKNVSHRRYALFIVTSEPMVRDVIRLGLTPRKDSRRIIPPMEPQVERHFMRGVFDGDGTIARQGPRSICFSLVAWPRLIRQYQRILIDGVGLSETSIIETGKVARVQYGGNTQVRRIGEWLYSGATVWLDRKRAHFTRLCGSFDAL